MTIDSNIYLAIIALATFGNGYINYRSKQNASKEREAQRLRDEAKAKATEERDKVLAEGTRQVAEKAAQVATATKEVKDHLEQSDTKTEEKLNSIKDKTDKTHTIVNSQKTLMLESFARQCGLTLSVTKSLAHKDPIDEDLRAAVITAQALYDKAYKDSKENETTS